MICKKCHQQIHNLENYAVNTNYKVCEICVMRYMFKCDKCNLYFWDTQKNVFEFDDILLFCDKCSE